MDPVSLDQLLRAQNRRYATKLFDKNAKISTDVWLALETSVVLTPSSYGLQPWKIIVVTDPLLKKSLRPHTLNQPQVEDCSHFLIFCAREAIDQTWVQRHLEKMASVRNLSLESLTGFGKLVLADLGGYRKHMAFELNARQCYIALGNLLTSAALLDVDACPMEGFFPDQYDKVLNLTGKGWKSVVCCALGYRNNQDKYSQLAKVRFDANEVIDRR